MFRGEFIRADGLVIPNNVTQYGVQMMLAAALRNTIPTFYIGLVDAAPDPELQVEQLVEPTIGTHGYARIAVTRDSAGWPGSGILNGAPWLETDFVTFAANGGNFDKTVQRLMLVPTATILPPDAAHPDVIQNPVYALSGAMPTPLVVTPDTAEADRTFKYRLYGA